jgi:hypothetical protein
VGAVIAVAGVGHAVRGGRWSRWATGIGGFAALGFAGYLLIQLAATTKNLGGDSMVLASGGPGLWVIAGGSLAAFGTLFLPASTVAIPARTRPRVTRWAERTRLVQWAGDLQSGGLRRGIQIGLGVVWLLDAALQFQPYMFGKAFVIQQLIPAQAGNPAAVASPAMWANRLILHDVAAWNAAFAVIQLAIAVGLLWRPTVKAALAGSIVWALSVWWLGEGLGGLLTGTASPVTGAPGAVILYALIALLVWPRRGREGDRDVATEPDVASGGVLGSRFSRAAWLVLWAGFAGLMLQPAVRAPGALHDAIAGNAAGQPWWLAALDRAAASAVGANGLACSIGLAVVFALIGAGVLWPATARPTVARLAAARLAVARLAVVLAVLVGLAIWVIGENFGMILMGNATDPNTGPLLVLLAAAFWPLAGGRKARPEAVGE